MARLSLALLLAVSGCSKGFDGKDSTGEVDGEESDADADADGDDTEEPIDDDLPDVTEGIETDVCTEYIGATSYFHGAYTSEGDDWYGQERWILYANEKWKEEGGADCVVVWNTVATEGLIGACTGCDFSLSVSATVDGGQTTCDPAIYAGEDTWAVVYDVDTIGEQTTFYFHDSGNLVGAGYTDGSAYNFLSEVSCLWF